MIDVLLCTIFVHVIYCVLLFQLGYYNVSKIQRCSTSLSYFDNIIEVAWANKTSWYIVYFAFLFFSTILMVKCLNRKVLCFVRWKLFYAYVITRRYTMRRCVIQKLTFDFNSVKRRNFFEFWTLSYLNISRSYCTTICFGDWFIYFA